MSEKNRREGKKPRMIALLIPRNNRIVACASDACVVCVCVCIAYPRTIFLEMEIDAEQSISLLYSRYSFILVYSTVYYCIQAVIENLLTIYRFYYELY